MSAFAKCVKIHTIRELTKTCGRQSPQVLEFQLQKLQEAEKEMHAFISFMAREQGFYISSQCGLWKIHSINAGF